MMRLEMQKRESNDYYFRLIDNGGKILLISESYNKKENVVSGIESLKYILPKPDHIEKKTTLQGKFFFHVKNNGQIICTSGLFRTADICDKLLSEMQSEIAQVGVIDSAH